MPTLRVEMFEGRSPEKKKALVKELTDATVRALGCAPSAVEIILYDIRKSDWATGGELWSEKS